MPRLTLPQTHRLVTETLMRCRTSGPNAEAVADALVAAEEVGQAGHGLRRVPSYAAQALSGKVDGHATPVTRQGRPGLLTVDACHGFAYPAIDLAVNWLTTAAPQQGIAVAGITRSHHCGVAGVTVERLADAGLVGIMFANSPAAMAPWGGRRALFGTNPIAFAAPRPDGHPAIVVDVSLSKVARGKIMAAEQRGDMIPAGWALDAEGQETTDPKDALAGTMVPMGDAKGTALALMVELLSAGLVGAHFGYEASSFFSAEGPAPGVGQMILAIDPAAFAGPGGDQGQGSAAALGRIDELAKAIEAESGARVPGTRRAELKRQAAAEGISVDDALLSEIEAFGRRDSA
ncbi:Ldh family oxidoreductase [Paracoccus onubensis]|uniref:Ldh family oxidoreductase n=1 Tax=Paracoccus onubensis TaxID=1675788 RepID=UPI002730826D|nr:Ldh family oxidoreductase [Paracoccus onubensis]MDP0926260.1 Ldh family oxidoreductase [Paracoccus onubensis]